MRIQSICPHNLEINRAGQDALILMPGTIAEVEVELGTKLVRSLQAIELQGESDTGPAVRLRYRGFGNYRWIPHVEKNVERGKTVDLPLWLGRFLLSQEPGNWEEAS